jgi:hypothetical protein
MINSYVRNITKLGLVTRDLIASAAGCFLFLPGYRAVARGTYGASAPFSAQNSDASAETLKRAGAAFFLLSFFVSEALTTIRALGH